MVHDNSSGTTFQEISGANKEPEVVPRSNLNPLENLTINVGTLHQPRRTVSWKTPEVEPLQPISATEILSMSTQTSPMDFRALTVYSPKFEDFKAIHNNEVGHHGLEHSYRKLMIKFGSKWAVMFD
jgi:hypothetical protein